MIQFPWMARTANRMVKRMHDSSNENNSTTIQMKIPVGPNSNQNIIRFMISQNVNGSNQTQWNFHPFRRCLAT